LSQGQQQHQQQQHQHNSNYGAKTVERVSRLIGFMVCFISDTNCFMCGVWGKWRTFGCHMLPTERI